MFVHAYHFRVLAYSSVRLWYTINDNSPALLLKIHLKTVSKWFVSISFGLWDMLLEGLEAWDEGEFWNAVDGLWNFRMALLWNMVLMVLFDLLSLAAEERKGTKGRDDRPAWPAGCGGRARVRRCAHLRVVQRHFRPCNRSLGQGDHLAGYRCVSSPFRSISLLIKNYNEIVI